MNFTISVEHIVEKEFETSLVLTSSGNNIPKKCTLHFELEALAAAWLIYTKEGYGEYVDVSFKGCVDDNFIIECKNSKLSYADLIDKFTSISLGKDDDAWIILSDENEDISGFYFMTQKSYDNYTNKHMKFYEK